MRTRILIGLSGILIICGISTVAAQVLAHQQIRLTSAEVAVLPAIAPGAGTSGIAAVHMVVLYGDPASEGPYTIALKVPPNTRIKAHTHRDERTAIVVRGTWIFGYGNQANDPSSKVLGPGSFYSEPAGEAHFARTGTDGAIVYISGWGPTDTHYVE